jgi:hypothetical protein
LSLGARVEEEWPVEELEGEEVEEEKRDLMISVNEERGAGRNLEKDRAEEKEEVEVMTVRSLWKVGPVVGSPPMVGEELLAVAAAPAIEAVGSVGKNSKAPGLMICSISRREA